MESGDTDDTPTRLFSVADGRILTVRRGYETSNERGKFNHVSRT
jgi:hypothetical protein